jgi:hypothetical protein
MRRFCVIDGIHFCDHVSPIIDDVAMVRTGPERGHSNAKRVHHHNVGKPVTKIARQIPRSFKLSLNF